MNRLIEVRTKLQNKIRRATPAEKETLREEKAGVTARITELRKQLKMNKAIEERSVKIQEKTDMFFANEIAAQELKNRKLENDRKEVGSDDKIRNPNRKQKEKARPYPRR